MSAEEQPTGSGMGSSKGRPLYAGEPITDSDEVIRAALEDVSIPTLMASLAHITGDTSLLRGDIRPVGIYLNEVQGFMAPEDQQRARELAFDVITQYRDSGSQLGAPLEPEHIAEMMNYLTAQEIPPEYIPMMFEELALDGQDARSRGWPATLTERVPGDFSVVIIGGGMSGILAGIRCRAAGIAFTILEKNQGVGGTWYENRYPGCRVDVGNHYYCYSFEPSDTWTEFFAQAPELREYFDGCTHRFGIDTDIVCGAEVTSAVWDEESGRWGVTYTRRRDDGSEAAVRLEANAVISAVGQLNRPKLPDLPGIESFAGLSMHSAQWQEGTDLAGLRVGVVGTGASAFQIVPTICDEVEALTVFQRSAPWMFNNPHYHDAVPEGVKWALRYLPYYRRWYRFLLLWPACDGGLPAMRVDPDWPHQDRAVSEINDLAREMFTQYMADQIPDDPELLSKVTPNYVCLGKRTLQDNGSWLTALQRPNVTLVSEGVAEVVPDGVVTVSGEHHELDLIVWATGFQANKFLWPMRIEGRNGAVLSDQWGDTPTALLGITVPNFPNFFCLYGPGTNLASGGSLIFHSECEIRYIMGCLAALIDADAAAIEVTQAAHDDYQVRLQAELDTMVWSHPSIENSWYRGPNGRIYTLSPWRLVDFWAWTAAPDLADYDIR